MSRQLVILGTPVTLPDPASVTDLAAGFQQQGGQLAHLQTTLQSLTRPEAWEAWIGQAADAFGRSIGQLPAQIGDVSDAYEHVASALQQYAGQLEPVVSSLSSLSYQAEDAEGALAAVSTARSQVMASGQDPATTGWDARLTDAAAAVTAVQGQLNRLLAELTSLAATCTKQIKAAEPKTAGKSLFGSLESDFVRDVADPLARAAKEVVKLEVEEAILEVFGPLAIAEALFIQPFIDLWSDFEKAREHFDAETLGQFLGDVAGVLGVVALLPIPGVDVVAGLAALAIGGVAAAADWVAVFHHEQDASVMQASLATVGVALSSVGMVAKAGADVANLDNGADAAKAGENLWEAGVQRAFTPSGIADQIADEDAQNAGRSFGQRLVNNVKDQYALPSDDPSSSPAAVTIARVGWTAGRLNDAMTAGPQLAGEVREVDRYMTESQVP